MSEIMGKADVEHSKSPLEQAMPSIIKRKLVIINDPITVRFLVDIEIIPLSNKKNL